MALVGLALSLSVIVVVLLSTLPGRLDFTIASIRHNPWYSLQGVGLQIILYAVPIYGLLFLARH
jgi:hypothetical protein